MKVEDVFNQGPLATKTLQVEKGEDNASPPKDLLLVFPSVPGDYPILLFLHGFTLHNNDYTQLLHHIASYGYITVAPLIPPPPLIHMGDATGDIEAAGAVREWMQKGLSQHLPENVQPDFKKVAISGHSRGGKVAFAVAHGRSTIPPPLPYAALVGVDPVDGTLPLILNDCFPGNIPTLVIGSGLGPLFPPCAPSGQNHVDFFRKCRAPAYHLEAVDYGHMDMLDDNKGGVGSILCRHGPDRERMRRFSGGIMVAFLMAYLKKESEVLNELMENPSSIPLRVEHPERKPPVQVYHSKL